MMTVYFLHGLIIANALGFTFLYRMFSILLCSADALVLAYSQHLHELLVRRRRVRLTRASSSAMPPEWPKCIGSSQFIASVCAPFESWQDARG